MAGPQRVEITPEILLRAYAAGIFPMSESADDPGLFWVEPRERGIVPLDAVHVSRRLSRTVRSDRFEIRTDTDFEGVIAGCAEPVEGREKTWINRRLRDLYGALFDLGHCHTVEAWREKRLVGGLYGISLGGAFFGESMFQRERDASKVAFVHLCGRLRAGRYRLLDAQFVTSHLATLGAVEIGRRDYLHRLGEAVAETGDWRVWPAASGSASGARALEALTAAS